MIELRDIHKTYGGAENCVRALNGVSLAIEPGEFVAIMGPSGSGKSTLLNILGILDGFDSGEYLLASTSVSGLSEEEAAATRNRFIGFVFQSFNLLPFLTALENVALPLTYTSLGPKERDFRAMDMLAYVGLDTRAHHRPSQLSGGQCQRVAIARALVTRPRVIFADEPTGALDSGTSDEIMTLFLRLHERGASIVMVTHASDVACRAQRIVLVRDGRVCE
ncbi:MAG: ABC transporter ATP-binding protein [Halioglobus sp.]|nr:ABC transporter ATP-binding protein [Halioglobus sp.]